MLVKEIELCTGYLDGGQLNSFDEWENFLAEYYNRYTNKDHVWHQMDQRSRMAKYEGCRWLYDGQNEMEKLLSRRSWEPPPRLGLARLSKLETIKTIGVGDDTSELSDEKGRTWVWRKAKKWPWEHLVEEDSNLALLLIAILYECPQPLRLEFYSLSDQQRFKRPNLQLQPSMQNETIYFRQNAALYFRHLNYKLYDRLFENSVPSANIVRAANWIAAAKNLEILELESHFLKGHYERICHQIKILSGNTFSFLNTFRLINSNPIEFSKRDFNNSLIQSLDDCLLRFLDNHKQTLRRLTLPRYVSLRTIAKLPRLLFLDEFSFHSLRPLIDLSKRERVSKQESLVNEDTVCSELEYVVLHRKNNLNAEESLSLGTFFPEFLSNPQGNTIRFAGELYS
ncbi:hypothetical protein MMC20_001019 [Loxospora ochrophaea]|nr:hypothetical protein [Loxospora ochrophaea]